MNIWKLVPKNFKDSSWEANTKKPTVIVRAENEDRTRRLATKEYFIATQSVPGISLKTSPWSKFDLVNANIFTESTYSSDGNECILEQEDS